MREATFDDESLLGEALSGSREALGTVLERFRRYLLHIARRELAKDLHVKVAPSDLVQETLLLAQVHFGEFRGGSFVQLRHWLRQMLLHVVTRFARAYRKAAKRCVAREVSLSSLPARMQGTTAFVDQRTAPPGEIAIAREHAALVGSTLERLDPDHRQVLLFRIQEQFSFEEIGRRMSRSANAAEKLFARAVQRMRDELEYLGTIGKD
jgi:RNA polymerase sigma-70 factor (ECF subfamily)